MSKLSYPGLRLGKCVLGWAGRYLAALLILIAGELIFRGFSATLAWAIELPPAVFVSAFYLWLWILVFESIFSTRLSLGLVVALFWLFCASDRAKFDKLGMPVLPSDLLLSRQYVQVINMVWGAGALVLAAAIFVALLVWAWLRWRGRSSARSSKRSSTRVLGLIALIVAVFLIIVPDYNFKNARFTQSPVASMLDRWGINNMNWDPVANVTVNGQLLSFLLNAKAVLMHEPHGYSEGMMRNLFADSTCEPVVGSRLTPGPAGAPPQVVVIMSEALWDPALLPGIRYSDPLLDRLKDADRGVMFSPVFGGYTANTEFEFLTRFSNAYLPIGSIPYMQYVNRPMSSLADDFRRAGYDAKAIHPFDGGFWNRRNVYPRLGFDAFIEGRQFQFTKRTPPYISDDSMSKEIIATISQGQKPHFVFAVSVQNHGAYLDGKTRYASESVVEVIDEHHKLTQESRQVLSAYATGVRDAALSFNEVVDYFKQSGRPAVVMMFGDHLPFLGDEYAVYTQAGYISTSQQNLWEAHDQERMHGTPVFIWSNVSGSSHLPRESISPIYLGSLLKRRAGLAPTEMDNLLSCMESEYPVISQFYSRSSTEGVVKGPFASGKVSRIYQAVLYDVLFGQNFSAKWVSEPGGGPGNLPYGSVRLRPNCTVRSCPRDTLPPAVVKQH